MIRNSHSRYVLPTLIILIGSSLGLFAQEEASEPATNRSGAYQLSNVSQFTDNLKGDRNPFWPIGWRPGLEPEKEEAPKPKFKPSDHLRISSTMMGETPLAIVNGKSYTVGEPITIQFQGQSLPVKVEKIRDREVVFSIQGKQFTLPQTSSF